ncbi:hypothetical protein [Nostoc sp. DSM 114159]
MLAKDKYPEYDFISGLQDSLKNDYLAVDRRFRAEVGVEKGEIRQANQSPLGIHWEDRTLLVGFLLKDEGGLFGT